MPKDQTLSVTDEPAEGRFLSPHAMVLAVAALFVILSFFMNVAVFRLALLFGGITLVFLTIALWLRGWIGRVWGQRLDTTIRQLMKHDADNVFLTDAGGRISYANQVATARFGECVGASLGHVFAEMLANPDPVLRRLSARVREGGASKEDIVTRQGHFRLSASAIGEERLLWRLDDLRELNGVAIQAPDLTPLPAIHAEPSGTITRLNPAARALLGRRPKTLSEIFDDGSVRSGQTYAVETAEGRKQVLIAELDGQDGARDIYMLPSAQNNDAPRQIEAGWDAIEDLPVPLLKIASDGLVLASNREARQLLHLESTQDRRMGDMLDGLGRPINDWLREASEGRGGQASQFLRGRGDNQDTFVQVTLNLAGGTRDPHLIAVLNDVTELKTLEAQFVQSQKMQAIGQLAGGVAHDFNNLLTAISGHCDLLLLRHDDGDQNYGDLIQIHQNANRAASLVGQLLAFSRKQNLQPEVIDLRDTLSDLTHLLNRLVGEKVTLSLYHDPALAQIKADKRQLEQVFMNLVVNARDAMDGAGDIKVVTENLTLKTQMIKDRAEVPPGEYVVVKVIDEGHGISPEKLQKIFEPFWTTKRPGEGTGLGLSTAYGIVKQTGGFIFAESELGKGTQFSLLFPSHRAPVAEMAPVVAPDAKIMNINGDGVVLLVEDEAPVRAFASRALRLRGYTVLEADCAEAALELLNDEALKVDIFVTDVIMPGMDGPTWVRQALKDRPDTRVVFVSGYAEDAFGDDQTQIPNSVFLPKPFSLNALTQTVHGQLH
ncbi:ATP-binding protein [Cognatiyoonia sp. IB215182]|nr:ATP-binding protein [Cognatiyoonia sp. IB215182]MDX8353463.1 ATP-binding protein [Cognatiyoonia sp. IB215182]